MSRPIADFDRVARIYRWAEHLAHGRALQRIRTHFLPDLLDVRHAWVIGDGDGRFLAALLQQNKLAEAVAVDTSSRMLDLLQQRCAFAADRVRTIKGSGLEHYPNRACDLIATHFFLDCLSPSELIQLIDTVAESCHPGARWLVSDFAIPGRQPWRFLAKMYVRSLYAVFRLLTGLRVSRLPQTHGSFTRAGFVPVARHTALGGLLYTEIWKFAAKTTAQQPPIEARSPSFRANSAQ